MDPTTSAIRSNLATLLVLATVSVAACGVGACSGDVAPGTSGADASTTADGATTDGAEADGAGADGAGEIPDADAAEAGSSDDADGDGQREALDGAVDTGEAPPLICPGAPGCACEASDECDDQDPCTVDGPCDGGACQGKTAASCDDGVACTTDTCTPSAGCQHKPHAGACQDGDPCTVGDSCTEGVCKAGKAAICSDGNVCTDDTCTPGVGCTFSHNTAICVDENACTEPALCDFAVCIPGALKPCKDNQVCTFSVCDPVTGCSHVDLPSATTCTDGEVVDGRCYRAFQDKKGLGWAAARSSCKAWGGTLATVHSKQANAAARLQANAACGKAADAWIGLNDRMREGVWRWGDGSSTDYQNWGSSEPNNAGNEDVTTLRADGMWNDRAEDSKKTTAPCWVCSRPLPTPCKASGAACVTGATCAEGSCDASAVVPDPCDDANTCTADSCGKGACGHVALPKGATCTGGTCSAGVCVADPTPPSTIPQSCQAMIAGDPTATSGVFWLHPTALPAPVSAHCDQTAGGGWTLVLKTEGKNKDFAYAGKNWAAKPTAAVANPGPEAGEALIATYWSVPVTQVRVVMLRNGLRREVVLNAKGASLHALLQSKTTTATNLGLPGWKQLLNDASLQKSCHTEGLNAAATNGAGYVRIGIIGNQENQCGSPDSWLGVGGIDGICGGKKGVFSGNIACYGADLGNRTVAAPTWVYVR